MPEVSPSEVAPATGPRYWRSLDEALEQPEFREFVEREFPQGASELDGVNRRQFLKIMAASFTLAGAGMTGCRRPEAHIMPYGRQPEHLVPGKPLFYASSHPRGRDSLPLLVETHQARPTKIEGNPDFAPYRGATDAMAQASVLDLYDPDRATRSSRGNQAINRAAVTDLLREVSERHRGARGAGLAFLAEPSTSPTRRRLVEQLKRDFPRAIWAEHDPVDQARPEKAFRRLFGQAGRPRLLLKNARRILSLDADFLAAEPGHLAHARDFADGRRVHHGAEADPARMNRLYQVESHMTITGGMADHRLRLGTASIPALAALIGAELLDLRAGSGGRGSSSLAGLLRERAGDLDVDPAWIEACVADLNEFGGRSVIVAGSHLPEEVHVLVTYLNAILGSAAVEYLQSPEEIAATLGELAGAIEAGQVETLLVLGGNPAYTAPAELDFENLVREKVNQVIRFGTAYDETSLVADVHIAAAHYLESWGDGRTWDGTYLPVQPMIEPLFDGLMELEVVARATGSATTDPYALVLETVRQLSASADPSRTLQQVLHDGFLQRSAFPVIRPQLRVGTVEEILRGGQFTAPAVSANSLEVRFVADSSVGDGRYNNNGWLQECPDPITKLTWDNAILISPALARELGFDPETNAFPLKGLQPFSRKSMKMKRGREIAPVGEVSFNGRSVKGPVHIQPGLADWTIVLPLGYGRRKVGRIGEGTGFDAYRVRSATALSGDTGARLSLTGETTRLANTQEHWSMEGRAIVREANVSDFHDHPEFVDHLGMESHSPPVYGKYADSSLKEKVSKQPRGSSAFETPTFMKDPGSDVPAAAHQWGMTIDLNACTGCNACVVACQSENNIPIVGKEQVMRGREMHWIRLDRYYSTGDLAASKKEIPADPQVSLMPVACVHCERAPCEQVCPVNATVHDEQGLNVMAYNRCVGTRYCANNCPYKVRRFNFFDWNKREIDHFYSGPLGPSKYDQGATGEMRFMQRNPDVSVRMRGVMEKCTFCQQRIEGAKIAQKVKARDSDAIEVPDGTIKTACQQACPAGAIEFGNLLDENSAVYRLKQSDRDYSLLGYLNTRPRTTFLARLRNPNPAMPDFHDLPLSRIEYESKSGGHHGGNGQGGDAHGDSETHETAHGEASHG